MRLISLTIENFMRIEAAHIRPDGAMTVIAGPNEAGKSTVVDAIWYALGGADGQPEKPVREGAKRASITLVLGDGDGPKLTVERIYTPAGVRLAVTEHREDGRSVEFRSPQKMLSAMLGTLTFDPEAFGRMKPKEQAELLARVVGLDTREIDSRIEALETERLHAGRDLRNFGDAPKPAGKRPEGVDVADLTRQLDETREQWRVKSDAERALTELHNGTQYAESMIGEIQGKILELTANQDYWHEQLKDRIENTAAAKKRIEAMGDPDSAGQALSTRMAEAESRNAVVRAYDQTLERHEHRQALVKQHEADEDALKAARAERAEMVASIEMPVDGLAIVDGAVRYGEHPFSQAAESRRLEIGVAIGAAQDPTLRLMRVEHGSLLDSRALAHLGELAEKYDMQVLVEKVADADTGCGLYIEDGRIAEREA